MAAIDVDGVSKRFGSVRALQDLSLTVEEGEIYGFLGPNGAGKSTTINVLLDFVRPDRGTASVLGMDAQENSEAIRQRTGVLPDGYQVYERLTARQHLEFVMESKGVQEDPHAILERVGIPDAIDRKAGGYSKGMAQRLVLGMSLVGDPELLILDEPTTGLDPNGAVEMREIIREERDRGATVFFSSHILAQVEAVCDRVGILKDGELVAEDTIEGLRDSMGGGHQLTVDVDQVNDSVVGAVRSIPDVTGVETRDSRVIVNVDESEQMAVIDAIRGTGATVKGFETREASLEDLFADITTDKEVAEPDAEGGAEA
ncbi:ABC transporter ATP-binding protein [Halobacteriales archaeon QS_8_69_26]|nr:MAG: ABC transporter ATP-binding protein [Halobacteriales archaeon QS_8_69_26]